MAAPMQADAAIEIVDEEYVWASEEEEPEYPSQSVSPPLATETAHPEHRHFTAQEWRDYLDPWIAFLDADIEDDPDYRPIPIDVIVDSGAMRGFYSLGSLYYLMHSKRFRVMRVAGASSGALSAVCLKCKCDIPRYIEMYETHLRPLTAAGVSIADVLERVMEDLLPSNAHELCQESVFITVTEAVSKKVYPISTFTSLAHLKNVLRCSISIPRVAIRGADTLMDGKRYIDGISPILPSAHATGAYVCSALYIDIGGVQYPVKHRYTATDPNIGCLIVVGMKDWERFIRENFRPDLPHAHEHERLAEQEDANRRNANALHIPFFSPLPLMNNFRFVDPHDHSSIQRVRQHLQYAVLKGIHRVATFLEEPEPSPTALAATPSPPPVSYATQQPPELQDWHYQQQRPPQPRLLKRWFSKLFG